MKNKTIQYVRNNAPIIALAFFMCIALSIFAYLGSDAPEGNPWNPEVIHSPSTPTIALVPLDGWWTTSTPTPKSTP